MATKVQQMQRNEGSNYRERRTPTVESLSVPRASGLPSSPVAWYPTQARGLDFAERLLGAAGTASSLMNTEAGKQYKDAQARAMRGDFAVNDNGLFTFTGAQQRAISEVEGTLDADKAVNELSVSAEEWRKELAADQNLSSAQRVAEFTRRVRESSYGKLSSTKDSDYLLAMGSKLHGKAEGIISQYRNQAIEEDLKHEADMTGQVFHNQIKEMPAGLDAEQESAYRTGALRSFYNNWTKVTGKSFDAAKPYLEQVVQDMTVAGDAEGLERLADAPLPDGRTMSSMGLITKATLETSRENEIKLINRESAKADQVFKENYKVYGTQAASLMGRVSALRDLTGADKLAEVSKIDADGAELLKTINALPPTALNPQMREDLIKTIDNQRTVAAYGGPRQIMPEAMKQELTTLVLEDTEAAYRMIRSNPQYIVPPELDSIQKEAWSFKDVKESQAKDEMLWSLGVVNQMQHPPVDFINRVAFENTPEYKEATLFLAQTLLDVKKELPDVGVTGQRMEVENRFYAKFPKEGADVKGMREGAEKAFSAAVSVNPKANPDKMLDAVAQFSQMDDANKRQFLKLVQSNPNLDADQRATLLAIANSGSDGATMNAALGELVTTREALEARATADLNQPKQLFGRHGNDVFKPLTPLADHRILVQENGKLVEKAPQDVSSADKAATGIYPVGARVVKGSKIIPVSSIDNEADLKLLDKEAEPVSKDPAVPLYNPRGYADSMVPRPSYREPLLNLNLTNREKPLEEHLVCILPDPSTPVDEYKRRYRIPSGVTVAVKKYGELTDSEKGRLMSAPFDPDYHVIANGGGSKSVVKMKDFFGNQMKTIVSAKPVEFMSAREQIDLLGR